MPKFTEIWSELQQSGNEPPFMLIDCAALEGGKARLPLHAFAEIECLFTGDLADELENVGPYLGRLDSFNPEVAEVAEGLIEDKVAMLVIAEPSGAGGPQPTFAEMHRHFRKFNVVYGAGRKPIFFRYYDSRIVESIFRELNRSQLSLMFRNVAAIYTSSGKRSLSRLSFGDELHVQL